MAVQEQTPLREYTANGVTTSFALGFDCEETNHLIVTIDDVEVLPTDWYLSGSNVVFWTAPGNGKLIKLQRNTPFNRLADYQSYNNSFRPPAINKEFDRIWWKLQELGVADWILHNRIDALKAYVDDRDDELRAYLMEEIRKQGVALDQLDEYYNYLMQRLAQIAVDKGWDASFVVDGDKNQHQINASFYSNSLTDYKTIEELKEAEITARKVNVSGSLYEWQPDNSTAADDVYFVQSNHSATGRWVNLVNTLQSASKPDTINLFRHRRKVELSQLHDISDTVVLGHDYIKVEGFGENSGFVWQGGNAPAQTDLALLKPIVALKKANIANAVSGAKLVDFLINVNDAQNVCAIDARYITNNSKVEGIRVNNIGINSVGYYVSKQWYARYNDCYALGRYQNDKQGVGVYVDTRSPESGTINQVNSITLDISCRDLMYGYLIDPSRYVYTLIIPAGVTIEKCGIGIKVVSPTLPVTIRNGVISAYFEKNDIDVEWGDISDTRALDQKITWLNCSFEDTGSKVILNQGQHIFIGCTGLETLVVNNNATARLDNTYVDIIQNNTGNSRNVLNLRAPNSVAGSSRYSDQSTKPLRSTSVGISLGSGAGTNPVTIDLLNPDTGIFLSTNIPTQGRKARIFAIAQRNYDTTTAFTWQGTVLQRSSGWYLIPDAGTWTITASIDSNGVLSLSSSGGDTKYYDVTVTAM